MRSENPVRQRAHDQATLSLLRRVVAVWFFNVGPNIASNLNPHPLLLPHLCSTGAGISCGLTTVGLKGGGATWLGSCSRLEYLVVQADVPLHGVRMFQVFQVLFGVAWMCLQGWMGSCHSV